MEVGQQESAVAQLERYMLTEIRTELERTITAEDPHSYANWTGIVTDGQHWHVYLYPHLRNPVEWRKVLHSGPILDGREQLIDKLTDWLGRDPVGRAWIPAEPSHLFVEKQDQLARLYSEIPNAVMASARTKHALWHNMLRVSGVTPQGQAAPDRLFVTHSFLIAIARLVTHSLTDRSSEWQSALREGFVGWILGWERGEAWAAGLWEIVSRYDWRRRRGDVLRSLYETFVPEADRKVFGEFYTPDWLAAMIVEQALDEDWLCNAIERAEDANRNGTLLVGTGVLDPACGSGTFLYHAALRILQAPGMSTLRPEQQADVAALLLNGIDVHPVAVEIARANLMRGPEERSVPTAA